jgi:hypothetical protein
MEELCWGRRSWWHMGQWEREPRHRMLEIAATLGRKKGTSKLAPELTAVLPYECARRNYPSGAMGAVS